MLCDVRVGSAGVGEQEAEDLPVGIVEITHTRASGGNLKKMPLRSFGSNPKLDRDKQVRGVHDDEPDKECK